MNPSSARPAPARSGPPLWTLGIVGAAIVVAVVAVILQARENRNPTGVSGVLKFDDSANRKTPEKLIKYRETGRIALELTKPRGLALAPDGRLYVAGDKLLRAYTVNGAGGAPAGEWPFGDDVVCVGVAPDGTVYAGVRDHVEVISSDGSRLASWEKLPAPARLTSIAASGPDVFVADFGNRIVWRFDCQGKRLGSLGRKDSFPGVEGFILPSAHLDVAVDGDLIWVANPGRHRVEAYRAGGEYVRHWGQPDEKIEGFCGCCNPTDFVLLPGGKFVTAEKGLARVKVYNPDGTLESVVAGTEAFGELEESLSLDVAAAPDGRVFVLDPKAKAVRIFARKE